MTGRALLYCFVSHSLAGRRNCMHAIFKNLHFCICRLRLIASLLETSSRQITATTTLLTGATTAARSASAPGGCGAASTNGGAPLEPSPLDERLRDEQEALRLNLAALHQREDLLQFAAKEWGKARAIMTGVRVSRKQAGPLQAILFSDTLARIRAFQKAQAQQQRHGPSDVSRQQQYLDSDRDQGTWPPPCPMGPIPARPLPPPPPGDSTAAQRHTAAAADAAGFRPRQQPPSPSPSPGSDLRDQKRTSLPPPSTKLREQLAPKPRSG
ncbi:hypothetical protein Vretimale_9874, partial [Volvox reticuliferus]